MMSKFYCFTGSFIVKNKVGYLSNLPLARWFKLNVELVLIFLV